MSISYFPVLISFSSVHYGIPDKLTFGGGVSGCGRYVSIGSVVFLKGHLCGLQIPDQPRTSQSPLDKADHIFKEYWQVQPTQSPSLSLCHLCTWPLQRLYRSKEEADSKMAADIRCLRSNQFTTVTREGLDFLRCIHSWKWCWASGKRMMVVGLGVGLNTLHF